jgi:hypothetical protein
MYNVGIDLEQFVQKIHLMPGGDNDGIPPVFSVGTPLYFLFYSSIITLGFSPAGGGRGWKIPKFTS